MRNPPNETRRLDLPSREREGSGEGLSIASPDRDRPSPSPSRKREGRGSHIPERTCILSREHGTREGLVRLALSPDGEVFPDVRAKAPGRGAWIGVGRAELEQAIGKGKLKGALARAFKGAPLSIPVDLPDRIAAALRQAALDRLGLEARSGTLVTGGEKIETAARRGQVHLLVHAADAGEDGRRKLDQALRVGSPEGQAPPQGVVFPEDRAILSLALGRQNVVHVALIDRAAAQRVLHALARWRSFIEPETGLVAGTAGTPDASADDVNEG